MKNIILVSIFIFVSLFSTNCKESKSIDSRTTSSDNQTVFKYVTPKSGLIMRSKPSTSGKKLGLIPFKSKVKIIEESKEVLTISGATGRWTKVNYNKQDAWVFGGFLGDEPSDSNENLDSGEFFGDKDNLKNYEAATSLFKKAKEVKKSSKEEALKLFKEANLKRSKIDLAKEKTSSFNRYDILDSFDSDIEYQLVEIEHCSKDNVQKKEFGSMDEAIKFANSAIKEKNLDALVSITGCVLATGRYGTESFPTYSPARKRLKEMLDKNELKPEEIDPEKPEEYKNLVNLGYLFVFEKDEKTKKWSLFMVSND
ncbi:MAG: SH3 domain-containing protein [Leptospiraceae bacterium]|nr:SH3 domain-containing protein [Leptospiraceae bacterium]MCP5503247.1 SH3 domain-containing protein [Leptospiraceae bacterium]